MPDFAPDGQWHIASIQKELPVLSGPLGAALGAHNYWVLVDGAGQIQQEMQGVYTTGFTVFDPVPGNYLNVVMTTPDAYMGGQPKIYEHSVLSGSEQEMRSRFEAGFTATAQALNQTEDLYVGATLVGSAVNSNSVWNTAGRAMGIDNLQDFSGEDPIPGGDVDLRTESSNNHYIGTSRDATRKLNPTSSQIFTGEQLKAQFPGTNLSLDGIVKNIGTALTSPAVFQIPDVIGAQTIQLLAGHNLALSFAAQSLNHAIWNSASGHLTDYQIDNHPLNDAEAFASDLVGNLSGLLGSFAGSQLGAELFDALGLPSDLGSKVGGLLGDAAAKELVAYVAQDFLGFTRGFGIGTSVTFDGILDSALNSALGSGLGSIGSFLGSSLSHLISDRVGPGADIGGAIGATVGSVIFFEIPILGSFIGSIVGSFLGGLFGGHPSVGPNATSWYEYSQTDHQFHEIDSTVDNGGSRQIAIDMAKAAADTVNEVLALIGGTVVVDPAATHPGIRMGSSALFGTPVPKTFGYIQGKFFVLDGETYAQLNAQHQFDSAKDAVTYGVLQTLHTLQIAGGDPVMKRALANSDATTIEGLVADLNVAHDYELYLDNPALFNLGLQNLDDPDNPYQASSQSTSGNSAAVQWSLSLARAEALHLGTAAASDVYATGPVTPVTTFMSATSPGPAGRGASHLLVFNFGTQGIILKLADPSSPVAFDRTGSGYLKQTDWIDPSNAFLVMDINNNGIIDDASEMLGTYFNHGQFPTGFAALASLDSNHDGVIDARDAAYANLRFWFDTNHNGRVDLGELKMLQQQSVSSISLHPVSGNPGPAATSNGASTSGTLDYGVYNRFDGVGNYYGDVFLANSPYGNKLQNFDGHPGWTQVVSEAGGSISMAPGAGFATLAMAGAQSQFIVGGNNGNEISLAGDGNQISGGMGSDTLHVVGNTNRLIAGDGPVAMLTADGDKNILQGGMGFDVLKATGGGNLLYAGFGDTVLSLIGSGGLLSGNSGSDALMAFGNSNTLQGGGGTNTLTAVGNDNVLTGGVGSDTITVVGDHNSLTAGSGAAHLVAKGSLNNLLGGTNNDILFAAGGSNTLDGGGGVNTADYSNAAAGVAIDIGAGAITNDGSGGHATLVHVSNIVGSAFGDLLTGDADANNIFGGAGADTIGGGGGNDTLSGGDGDDSLTSGAGNDIIDGGAGRDLVGYQLASSGVNVSLSNTAAQNTAGGGIDTLRNIEDIYGSNFDDLLTGSTAANLMVGLNGNDILFGNGGNDSFLGGNGNDTIIGGVGNDTIDGGAGIDWAGYLVSPAGVTVSLAAVDPQNTGGAGIDKLVAIENLEGSNFNDMLAGNASSNVILGHAGNDSLSGDAGADSLYGQEGDDTISGGTGNDFLSGGAGNDRFVFAPGYGADTIADFTAGAHTDDKVDLSAFHLSFVAAFARASQSGSDTVFNFGSGDALTLQNVVKTSMSADDFFGLKITPDDFNSNSNSDILWSRDNGTFSIWDDGQIGNAHIIANPGAVPNSSHIAGEGDFDGNGRGDILWRDDDGTVFVWDDGSSGNAHVLAGPGAVANSWHISGAGDFDGNGQSDILWRNDNGAASIWDNGAIGNAHIIANAGIVPNSWHISGIGDFDADGLSDILWRNDNGAVSIWDTGAIGNAHIVADAGVVPNSWHISGTGDFDGNGHDDILWRNDNGAVSIWDNGQIGGAHIVADAGVVPNSWHLADTGDYDGNGHSDILWRNDSGAVSIWDNGDIAHAHIIANPGVVPTDWHIV
jgi:Ca2+-binding RTX toxin-like protein